MVVYRLIRSWGVVALVLACVMAGAARGHAATTTNPFGGPTGAYPTGIAVDANGNIYTANVDADSVTRISADGTTTAQFGGTTGNGPNSIAIDGDGNVYTANFNSNSVTRISADGTSTTQFGGTTGKNPLAIAVDADGNVYTANVNSNSVTRISADGTSTTQFGTTGDGPNSIAVDTGGNVYTANNRSNSVTRISADGTSTTQFGGTTSGPYGIALDAEGNVYTTNFLANTVTRISADGTSTTEFGTTGQNPYGLAVDADGNVYTANYFSNTVTRISPDRGPVTFTSGAFQRASVGSPTPLTVTVTNTGEGSVRPTAITAAGTGVAVTGGTCVVGTRIDAGGSCSVVLTWTPTTPGALQDASLTIIYPGGAGTGEALVLTGTAVQPRFFATPESVAFGDQQTGTSSVLKTVTVTNTGTADLTLDSTRVTGDGFTPDADTCAKATVAPGATCTVKVAFTPARAGSATGSLTFTSDAAGSPHSISLSGTGVTPAKKRQTLKPKLPQRIKLSGLTLLTPANARTNASQRVHTLVRGGPSKSTAAGQIRYFTVVRGANGRTSVRTYGYLNLTLRVTQKASATSGYTAFTRTATYTEGTRG